MDRTIHTKSQHNAKVYTVTLLKPGENLHNKITITVAANNLAEALRYSYIKELQSNGWAVKDWKKESYGTAEGELT